MKIISLNIEGDKHLGKVLEFLQRERADVVCLQEAFVEDFNWLKKMTSMEGLVGPAVYVADPGKPGYGKQGTFGTGILSRLPGRFNYSYYFHQKSGEKIGGLSVYRGRPNSGHRVLVWQEAQVTDGILVIATTHFTWSAKGKASNRQRRDLKKLLRLLDKVKPGIFCGDFNAPREGEIFGELSRRFRDNIPLDVTSTLDHHLHYAGRLDLVVDGFFTNSKCQVENVRLVSGISDHLAVVGNIKIVQQ